MENSQSKSKHSVLGRGLQGTSTGLISVTTTITPTPTAMVLLYSYGYLHIPMLSKDSSLVVAITRTSGPLLDVTWQHIILGEATANTLRQEKVWARVGLTRTGEPVPTRTWAHQGSSGVFGSEGKAHPFEIDGDALSRSQLWESQSRSRVACSEKKATSQYKGRALYASFIISEFLEDAFPGSAHEPRLLLLLNAFDGVLGVRPCTDYVDH